MSLFQCDKCGVIENTALAEGGHLMFMWRDEPEDIQAEWRNRLGLKAGEPFGKYCCVCNPIWYTAKGAFGRGENPNPRKWHGRFPQEFHPVGTMKTDRNGNISEPGGPR